MTPTPEPGSLLAPPHFTIWVMRPDDDEPWCWGGSYDDPTGQECEKRVLELEAQYPKTWAWAKRVGLGRDES